MSLGSRCREDVRFIPATDPFTQSFEQGKDQSVGFVFPVYAWGVPPIVLDFIKRLPESMVTMMNDEPVYTWCVATCGDETGMAVEMLKKALRERGINLSAAWSLIMPNVYVLLPGFGVDPKEVEKRKLNEAIVRIQEIAEKVNRKEMTDDVHLGPMARLKTALIYPLFKRWGVNTKKWHYTDRCIGCGKCVQVCPVGNITMANEHPVWGKDCTSCCGCYHICPTHSAEYGKATKGKGQYFCKSGERRVKGQESRVKGGRIC